MQLKIYLVIFCIVLKHASSVSGSWSNCTNSAYNEKAFIGWSILVPCKINEDFYYNYYDYYDSLGDCRIWDNGRLVYNITDTMENLFATQNENGFLIVDLQNTTSKNFVIEVQLHDKKLCSTVNFSINAMPFVQESCHEFLERKLSEIKNVIHPADIGTSKLLYCDPDERPLIAPMENLQYEWLRNCSTLPDSPNLSHISKKLILHKINYTDAGLYICSVSHNGMTRYTAFLPICVADPHENHKPILSCTRSEVQGTVGKEFGVNCTATFGKGSLPINKEQLTYFRVGWHKVNSKAKNFNVCKFSSNERISCTLVVASDRPPCSLYIPPANEIANKNATVFIRFKIKNIKSEDFGQYYFEILPIQQWEPSATQLVLFSENVKPILKSAQTILIAFIVSFVTAIALALLIWFCGRTYLKHFYRRYFEKGVRLDEDLHETNKENINIL